MACNSHQRFQPELLQTLCLDVIAYNLDTISSAINFRGLRELHPHISLTMEISESIVKALVENGFVLKDKIVHIFRDTNRSRLSTIDLSNAEVTDWGLQWLARQPIIRLDVSKCWELSTHAVPHILELCEQLQVLLLGNKAKLFLKSESCTSLKDFDHKDKTEEEVIGLRTPQIRAASFHALEGENADVFVDKFLKQPLEHLQVLDLSRCKIQMETLYPLRFVHSLKALVLYGVLDEGFNLEHHLHALTPLKRLRHLDISLPFKRQVNIQYPSIESQNRALAKLIYDLPELVSLDISGTHLAGRESDDRRLGLRRKNLSFERCALDGLNGRRFTFLGLLNCLDDPCSRPNLPADRVTGDHTIEQVVESLKVYQRRSSYCNESLTNLYHMLKDDYDCVKDKAECLKLICQVMRQNMRVLERQISGSAAMFYLIKTNKLHQFTSGRLIRIAMKTLFDAMDTHFGDKSMLRNGLLTMCSFTIPDDLLFIYKPLVCLLLNTIRQCDPLQDEFIQRISIYILNALVCRVDNHEKLLVGDEGAVKTMLWLIKSKIDANMTDEILEMAWSTLWNITDETSMNCVRFLEGEGERKGLTLFLQCFNAFCSDIENNGREALLRNMMGLLGNVAEVQNLRKQFLKSKYLHLFRNLLQSCSDGIEVSYNAAGIICHIASDGEDIRGWSLEDSSSQECICKSSDSASDNEDIMMMDSCDNEHDENHVSTTNHHDGLTHGSSNARQAILSAVVSAISRWDLNSTRSINYRSFKPILRLLECSHTVEVRHWAVWALCNLTTVYPEKYVQLLREEDGLNLLENLGSNKSGKETPEVVKLAQLTLENCQNQQ